VAFSKQDTAIAAGVLLLVFAGRKALAASKPGASSPPPPKPPIDPKADGAALLKRANQAAAAAWAVTFASVPDHPISPLTAAALLKRANQAAAAAWAVTFASVPDHPISPLTAAALARWAGIESSGKATNASRLNERGLLQAGPQTVDEGGLTQSEFDALIAASTSRAQHAALAIKYADWLAKKAFTYVARPPVDPVEIIWYAKLWHQRPVDVRDNGLTGDAIADARMLALKWAADPKAMHRLRAANVVAWGTPTP
jgi:hypothetical protein